MPLTIAPSDEACEAIVARINAGTTYALEVPAEYSRLIIDPLEQISGLRIDVTHDDETQPAETLDDSDQSSHALKVWVRARLPADFAQAIKDLSLLRRLIFLQLNNWTASDRRVQVWECDQDPQLEEPSKAELLQQNLYVGTISLRVEVAR